MIILKLGQILSIWSGTAYIIKLNKERIMLRYLNYVAIRKAPGAPFY